MTILLVAALLFSYPFGPSSKDVNPRDLTRRYEQAFQSGGSRWKEGNFEGAERLLETALELAREMKDAEKEVGCLLLLGRSSWVLGQMDRSEKFYSEALSDARKANLEREEELSRLALEIGKLYSQGQAELYNGRYEKSIAAFQAALELARKIGSREHVLKCLRQLSLVFWAQPDLENFLAVNKNSLEIAQELSDRREKAKALISLGTYYLTKGDYTRALDSYSEALETSRDAGNKRDESLCLQNLGLILAQLGFYERSLNCFLEAYGIDRQLGKPGFLPQNMINLGESFRNKWLSLSNWEDLDQALDYFTEALEWGKQNGDEQTELRALNNIGNIHLHFKKYFSARSYFRRSQKIAAEAQDIEALLEVSNNLGICYFNTDHIKEAETCFQAALDKGRSVGRDKILWETLFYLGRCCEKKGKLEKALNYYNDSMSAIEHIRTRILAEHHKVGFMRDKFKVYEAVINLLYRSGFKDGTSPKAEEIFYAVERAKARAFLETLSDTGGGLRSQWGPSLEREERDISGRIAAVVQEMARGDLPQGRRADLQKTLKNLEDEYINFISRIRSKEPGLAGVAFPLPIRVKEVQESLLDEKTAILEYFLGEENSLLFLVTQKKLDVFHLPPRREIEHSIDGYVKLLSGPPKEEWSGFLAARRLSRDLLLPALNILPPSVERIIFIPDGPLWHLPFDTLAFSPTDSPAGEDFLISRYPISYAPSCSSLLLLRDRKKKDRQAHNLLAFGNPVPPPETSPGGKRKISIANILRETYETQGIDFSTLPQSDREIREISRFFSRDGRTIFLHKEASEAMIKRLPLEDYPVVHFACHAFIDEKVPYRSALILSSDGISLEDGFLQVREIANLRLAAELVVLSACETGQGRLEQGEGVLGLSRIFFYSGARSVVSTLWKIGDKATAMFMRQFYFHLSQGLDKAQAMRLAKLRLLKSEYSHPFYWAPFELHGECLSALDLH